jgi:pyruvate dehydrogenase kinase 2/3/4
MIVGIICTKTNVHQIAREAIENATYVCEEHYGLFKGPPVQLICPKDLNFMYVPSHLVSTSKFVAVLVVPF